MKIYSTFIAIIILVLSSPTQARIFELYPPGDPSYTISIQQLISGVSFGGDDSDIDTLILKDGTYTENITIGSGDYNIHIMSENGYENVTVNALSSSLHVFSISASNVTIEGLTIYGATGSGRMGVYISGGHSQVVKDCRIGYDASHNNYQGIQIQTGVYGTVISNNIINYNTDVGVYCQYAYNLSITDNDVSNNSSSGSSYKAGIYLLGVYSSTVSGNTANNNNRYGVYLIGSGAVNNTIDNNTFTGNGYSGIWGQNTGANNFICRNSCSSNTSYDIGFSGTSIGNYVFLNDLTKAIAQFQTSSNTFYSPITFYYNYGGSYYKNYLGNYYGGSYTDTDTDGIVDGSGTYNTAASKSNYGLQQWSLFNDSDMYFEDMGKSPGNVTLGSSSSVIWKSNEMALSGTLFSGTDSWTGQVVFSTAPSAGHTFSVELGTTTDGSSITLGGPDATITGDGSTTVFQFATDNSEFTLAGGEYLAVQITNNSGSSYDLVTGGAFNMVTPPESSAALPVELTSFSAVIKGDYIELKWQTATENNNYGFQIERAKLDNEEWKSLGFVEGAGNANSVNEYTFKTKCADSNVKFRLKQIDVDGSYSYSQEIEVSNIKPDKYSLNQNYPNPFNPSTIISYQLPTNSFVNLSVYNLLGQEVATLVNEQQQTGDYEIKFDASSLSSGIYLYTLSAGNFKLTKRMTLLK